jgi:opacity protein-like surface antigen
MILMLLRIVIIVTVIGGMTFPGKTVETSRAGAAESADVYISLSAIGGFPQNRAMSLAGREVNKTTVSNSAGGGFKVGIFPEFTHRALGVELEYFGTTGKLSALIPQDGSEGKASSGLTVLNSMINLVLRHSLQGFRPYVGFGFGYSGGILHGADFPGRPNSDVESTAAFAYQFIGGLQWSLTSKTFIFSEYKHFVANFHWKALSLEYRANYVLVGFGWSF